MEKYSIKSNSKNNLFQVTLNLTTEEIEAVQNALKQYNTPVAQNVAAFINNAIINLNK